MRIGELSSATGVSRRLLRYYEEQGLLTPDRTEHGYREYGPDAAVVVAQVRALLGAGLGTGAIRALLPCAQGRAPALTPCPDLLATLRRERRRLDARITALVDMRETLDRYLDEAAAQAARLTA